VGQVLVHGHKDIELAPSPAEQFTVYKATPPMASHGPDVVAWQLGSEIGG